MVLAAGTLGTSAGVIYQNEGNNLVYVGTILFHNTTPQEVNFTLHYVPNDNGNIGTANSNNEIDSFQLSPRGEAGSTYEFSPKIPYDFDSGNDTFQALSSNSDAINYNVLGYAT